MPSCEQRRSTSPHSDRAGCPTSVFEAAMRRSAMLAPSLKANDVAKITRGARTAPRPADDDRRTRAVRRVTPQHSLTKDAARARPGVQDDEGSPCAHPLWMNTFGAHKRRRLRRILSRIQPPRNLARQSSVKSSCKKREEAVDEIVRCLTVLPASLPGFARLRCRGGSLGLDRQDADALLGATIPLELDRAIDHREERVVASDADVAGRG